MFQSYETYFIENLQDICNLENLLKYNNFSINLMQQYIFRNVNYKIKHLSYVI